VVLEEPIGAVAKPLAGLHGHPPEVEGVSRVIIVTWKFEVKAWDRSAHDLMLPAGRLLSQSDGMSPITSEK
jgi:hypothetical protein